MARGAKAIHESCKNIGNVAGIIGTIIGFAIPIAAFIYCVVNNLI